MPIKRRFSAAGGGGGGATQTLETHPAFANTTVNNGSTWQTVDSWRPVTNTSMNQITNESGQLKQLSITGSFTVGASALAGGRGYWQCTRDDVVMSGVAQGTSGASPRTGIDIRGSTAVTISFTVPIVNVGAPNLVRFQYQGAGNGLGTDGATINDLVITGRYEEE